MSEGGEARNHEAEIEQLRAENERLRAFAFGDAPDWKRANATLKHRVRELEAELNAVRRSPQSEDHEAGIEAALQAYWESTRVADGSTTFRDDMRAAIAAYLSRCPSPESNTEAGRDPGRTD
jgi:hypothetical protein